MAKPRSSAWRGLFRFIVDKSVIKNKLSKSRPVGLRSHCTDLPAAKTQ
jgi:hypothetical protein